MEYYARRERNRKQEEADVVDNQPRAVPHNARDSRVIGNNSVKTKAPDYSEHSSYPHHSDTHSSDHSEYVGDNHTKHTERYSKASKHKHEEKGSSKDQVEHTAIPFDTENTDIKCEVETEPECTVMLWEQFLENPAIMHDALADYAISGNYDTRFLDLTGADRNKKILEFEVKTAEDMENVTRDLVRRHILFRGKVTHTQTQDHTKPYETNTIRDLDRIWNDKLAVLVNTGHDNIRETLQTQLDTAAKHLKEGEQFCLELSFGYGVRRWYSLKVDRQGFEYYPTSRTDGSSHMCIFVHNCSPPVRFYMHEVTMKFLCPCWFCACGPCYYCRRKKKVTDMKERFHVTVTARQTDAERPRHLPCWCCTRMYQMETYECTSLTWQNKQFDKIF